MSEGHFQPNSPFWMSTASVPFYFKAEYDKRIWGEICGRKKKKKVEETKLVAGNLLNNFVKAPYSSANSQKNDGITRCRQVKGCSHYIVNFPLMVFIFTNSSNLVCADLTMNCIHTIMTPIPNDYYLIN